MGKAGSALKIGLFSHTMDLLEDPKGWCFLFFLTGFQPDEHQADLLRGIQQGI